MKIKIVKEYYRTIVAEWYDPDLLSGEGDLEDQICEYEAKRATIDDMYTTNMKRGDTRVEIVEGPKGPAEKTLELDLDEEELLNTLKIQNDSCLHCLSKTCAGDCPESEEDDVSEPANDWDSQGVNGYEI